MAKALYRSNGIRISTCMVMIVVAVALSAMAVLLVMVSISRWDIYVQTGETYLTTFDDGTQGYVNQGEIRNVARFGIGTRVLFWSCAVALCLMAVLVLMRLRCAVRSYLVIYDDSIEGFAAKGKLLRGRSFSIPLSTVVALRIARWPVPGVLITCSSGTSIRCDCRNPKTVFDVITEREEHWRT